MMVPIILGVIIGVLSSGSGLGGGFLVVPFLLHLGKEVRVAVGTLVFIYSYGRHIIPFRARKSGERGLEGWRVSCYRGNTGGASGTVDSRKYF